jgi:deazaflavin-dependent oxidoreductase (nitroreductase family)
MRLLWHLGLGRFFEVWPALSGSVMLLTHVGRKSGRRYQQPLNYAIAGGDIYCVAGFGDRSDWCRNLRAHPAVEVWLPGGRWAGVAEEIGDSPDWTQRVRGVLIGSGLAARLFGLNPHTMSDEDIVRACQGYRLFRIRRSARLQGRG